MPTHEDQDDAFGFETVGASTKERIARIRPAAPRESPSDLSKLDEVAASAGFISREVSEYQPRRGRPAGPEAFEALNMRAPASLARAFKGWCEENRYSYPAGLSEIMRRAGIPTA